MTTAVRAGSREVLPRPDDGAYYTPRELAGKLRRSVSTLTDWRYKNIGPEYVKIHGRALYPANRLAAWLTEGWS